MNVSREQFIVDWAELIKSEIADDKCTRKTVAHTYSILMGYEYSDFAAINAAIIKRWSRSGLEFIKEHAHKIARRRSA